MKFLIGIVVLLILVLAGCSTQTTIKYQCVDGSFVDSANSCSSKTCPEANCPKLDCASCPVKTETKIETNTLTNTVYVCSDLREVGNKDDCLKADSEGWYEVKTFSGSGDKSTETFKINSEKWRYTVTCIGQHKSTGVSYALRVYKLIDNKPSNVNFIASANCKSNIDPSYIYDGQGEYFFEFDTANVDDSVYTAIDSLTIKVEAIK